MAGGSKMAVSYMKLWHLLLDKRMTRSDLEKLAGVSHYTMTQMGKDKDVIIVERMVNEIDEIVKIVRFPGWKDTPQGRNDVEKALRSVFVRKKLFDNELFEKAYEYVEQYY